MLHAKHTSTHTCLIAELLILPLPPPPAPLCNYNKNLVVSRSEEDLCCIQAITHFDLRKTVKNTA